MGAEKINITWKDKQLACLNCQDKRLIPVRNKQKTRQTTEPNWNLQTVQEMDGSLPDQEVGASYVAG